jgi:hypothetical protein
MKQNNWLKLLLKCVLLSGLILVSFGVVRYVYVMRMSDTVFTAAIIDKHTNLNKIKAPRLIILGGSNMLYGVNSDTLQKYLKKPVMNMAMMAPMGLNFLLGDLEQDLQKGDTVLLSAEYEIEVDGDTEYLLWAADFYKPATKFIVYKNEWQDKIRATFLHQIRILQEIVSLKSANLLRDNLIYFRGGLSPKGDIKSHENKGGRTFNKTLSHRDSLNYSTQITAMNKYIDSYNKKGVKVYFTYANLAKTTFDSSQNAINSVEFQLNKNLHCKILGKPKDFVYPDSLFFDSYYHLRPKGRELRTKRLIELLNTENN